MAEPQVFRIKNRFIVGLAEWLNNLSLFGPDSRERTRFVNEIAPKISEYLKFKDEIVSKYALTEKTGERKIITKDGQTYWDIPDKKLEDFNNDIKTLEDEEFVLVIDEGHRTKVKTVRSIVLNTDFRFGPLETDTGVERDAKIRQAQEYNSWCEAFEQVKL